MQLIPADLGYPANTASNRCYLSGCTNGDAPRNENTVIIDTETQIDMEGWMMICEDCATKMANLLGFTSPTETKRQLGRIRNLEDQVVLLEREVLGIQDRVAEAVRSG